MSTTKSARDMGVVEFPRGSGAWHARVIYQGKQYWRRAANKTHARDLYHEMKTLIRKGEFPPERDRRQVLFADLLEDYRAVKRREGRAVMASDIGYVRLLQRFGEKRAGEISAAEVDAWRRDLAETMAPATVNLHLCLLRAILRFGVRVRRVPSRRGEAPSDERNCTAGA